MSGASDPIALLEALPRYAQSGAEALKPGLERIEALLRTLGDPHRSCPVVHVAGTNGKGSTASMIAAIATAAGLRVGLHTSPHLVDVTERMRVDGRPAPGGWFSSAVEGLSREFSEVRPSYFEATVALAFEYFRSARVDLAVVETGLGGRLDATNVVSPVLSVLTDIAMDHAEILGPTLAHIAREKAGIIKPGVPVVATDSGEECTAVFREVATRLGSDLEIVSVFPHRVLDLQGRHQERNAALAVAAARRLARVGPSFARFDEAVIETGLRETRRLSGLRARFETVSSSPFVVVDVAHNPDGLRTALDTFQAMTTGPNRFLFFALMADKDVRAMARLVADAALTVVPVSVQSARALDAQSLARILADCGCEVLDPVADPCLLPEWLALHLGPDDSALVAGSFSLAGPFLAAWPGATP